MKKAVAIVSLALVMLFALTACGGGNSKSDPIIGDWSVETISAGGVQINAKDAGKEGLMDFTFTEKEYTVKSSENPNATETNTWTKKGNDYVLKSASQEITLVMKDGKLTLTETSDGIEVSIILAKK